MCMSLIDVQLAPEWHQQLKLCYLASKQAADAPERTAKQIWARRRACERVGARARLERDIALEARLKQQDGSLRACR